MPDHVTKRCSKCGEVKPLDEFAPDGTKRDGHRNYCRKCRSDQERRRYQANREAKLEHQRGYYRANTQAVQDYQRRYRENNRDIVFGHYGRSCTCCGSSENLTIDHVNGDGAQHRRELYGDPQRGTTRFYRWLIRNGFPDGFQTLCHRCNSSKRSTAACRLDHS